MCLIKYSFAPLSLSLSLCMYVAVAINVIVFGDVNLTEQANGRCVHQIAGHRNGYGMRRHAGLERGRNNKNKKIRRSIHRERRETYISLTHADFPGYYATML